MKRITPATIDEMRANGYDRSVIADAQTQLVLCDRADLLIEAVRRAFDGVVLEGGTGLQEAAGLDDYAGSDELELLRASDEKLDWRRISPTVLSRCEAAPSYLDAKGMRFHVPAFLVAELSGLIDNGFISRLIRGNYSAKDFPSMLTQEQCNVLRACLRLYGELYPAEYSNEAIANAQARFTAVQGAEPSDGAESR
jgi:hypothetical protein